RVQLLEFHEQPFEILRVNAETVVFDLEAKLAIVLEAGANADAPAIGRELQRVGHIVVQDLLESGRIGDDTRQSRIDENLDRDLLGVGKTAYEMTQFGDGDRDIHRFWEELHLAGGDLRQVQDVVDE